MAESADNNADVNIDNEDDDHGKRRARVKRKGTVRPKGSPDKLTTGKRRRLEISEKGSNSSVEGRDDARETPAAKQHRKSLYGRTIGLFGRAVGGAVGLLTPGRALRQSASNTSPKGAYQGGDNGGASGVRKDAVDDEVEDEDEEEEKKEVDDNDVSPQPQQRRRHTQAPARRSDGEGSDVGAAFAAASKAAGEGALEAGSYRSSADHGGSRSRPDVDEHSEGTYGEDVAFRPGVRGGLHVDMGLRAGLGGGSGPPSAESDGFTAHKMPRSPTFGCDVEQHAKPVAVRRDYVPDVHNSGSHAFGAVSSRSSSQIADQGIAEAVSGIGRDRVRPDPVVVGKRPVTHSAEYSQQAPQRSDAKSISIQQRRAAAAAAALSGGGSDYSQNEEERESEENGVDEYDEPFTAKEVRDLIRAMQFRRNLPPAAALYLLSKLESPSAAVVRLQIIREHKESLDRSRAAAAGAVGDANSGATALLPAMPGDRYQSGFDGSGPVRRGTGAAGATTSAAARSDAVGGGGGVPLIAPVARRRFAPPGAELLPSAPLRNAPLMLPPPPRGISGSGTAGAGAARDGSGMMRTGLQYDRRSPSPPRGGDPDGLLTPARRLRAREREQGGGRERLFAASTPGGDRVWQPAATASQGTPWAGTSRTRAYGGGGVARNRVVEKESPLIPRLAEDRRVSMDRYGEQPRTPAAMARRIIRVLDDATSPMSPLTLALPASTPPHDALALRPEGSPDAEGPLPTKMLSVPHPQRNGGSASDGADSGRNKTVSAAKLPPSRWLRREIQTQTEGGRLSEDDLSPSAAKRQSNKRKTDEYEGEGEGAGGATDTGGEVPCREEQREASSGGGAQAGTGGTSTTGENDDETSAMLSPHRNKRARTNGEALFDQTQQQNGGKDDSDVAVPTTAGTPASSKAGKADGAKGADGGEPNINGDKSKANPVSAGDAGKGQDKNTENGQEGGSLDVAVAPTAMATAPATPGRSRFDNPTVIAGRQMEIRRRDRHLSGQSPYVRGGGRVDPNGGLPTSIRPPPPSAATRRVGFPFSEAKETPSQKEHWICRGCYVQNYDMKAKECDMCRRAQNFGTPQFKNPRARLPGGRTLYNNTLFFGPGSRAGPVDSPAPASSSVSSPVMGVAASAAAPPTPTAAGTSAAPVDASDKSGTASSSATVLAGSIPQPAFGFSAATSDEAATPAATIPTSISSPAPSFSSAGTPSTTTTAAAAPASAATAFVFGAGAAAATPASTTSTAPTVDILSTATGATASGAPAIDAAAASAALTAPVASKPVAFLFSAAATAPATAATVGASPAAACGSTAAGTTPSGSDTATAPAATAAFSFGSTGSKAPAPPAPVAAPGASTFTFGSAPTTSTAAGKTQADMAAPSPVAAFTFGAAPATAPASTTPTSFIFGGTSAPAAAGTPGTATPASAPLFGAAAPGSSTAAAGAPSPAALPFSFGLPALAPAGGIAGPLGPAPGSATTAGVGLAAPTPSAFGGFGSGGFGAAAGATGGTKRASSPAVGAGVFSHGTQAPPTRGPSPGAAAFGGGFGGGAASPAPPASTAALGSRQPAASGGSMFGTVGAAPYAPPASGAPFSFGGAVPSGVAPAPGAGGFGSQAQQASFGAAAAPAGGAGFGVVPGGFGGVPAAGAAGAFNVGAESVQQNAQTRGRRIVRGRRQTTTRRR